MNMPIISTSYANVSTESGTTKVLSFSLLLVCIQLPAQAATIYSSNFNSATPGQALSAPPLNWSADAGVVRVGTTQHPGWSGNAVVGSLSTSAGYGYAQASIDLPAMPTTGTIALTFDGWAYSVFNIKELLDSGYAGVGHSVYFRAN